MLLARSDESCLTGRTKRGGAEVREASFSGRFRIRDESVGEPKKRRNGPTCVHPSVRPCASQGFDHPPPHPPLVPFRQSERTNPRLQLAILPPASTHPHPHHRRAPPILRSHSIHVHLYTFVGSYIIHPPHPFLLRHLPRRAWFCIRTALSGHRGFSAEGRSTRISPVHGAVWIVTRWSPDPSHPSISTRASRPPRTLHSNEQVISQAELVARTCISRRIPGGTHPATRRLVSQQVQIYPVLVALVCGRCIASPSHPCSMMTAPVLHCHSTSFHYPPSL